MKVSLVSTNKTGPHRAILTYSRARKVTERPRSYRQTPKKTTLVTRSRVSCAIQFQNRRSDPTHSTLEATFQAGEDTSEASFAMCTAGQNRPCWRYLIPRKQGAKYKACSRTCTLSSDLEYPRSEERCANRSMDLNPNDGRFGASRDRRLRLAIKSVVTGALKQLCCRAERQRHSCFDLNTHS